MLTAGLLAAGVLLAEEREAVEGQVVELSEGDIVVDVAHQRGAVDGAVLELWRPLVVKHPVTGRPSTTAF